jgi:imidazolonepropionase-like amidohydrolase
MHRRFIRQILWTLMFGLVAFRAVAAQDVAFTGARIVDPARRQIDDGVLLVRNGRIAGVLSSVPAGFRGQQIDLGGRWVIPGLVDMHTHSFANSGPGNAMQMLGPVATARLDLYAGVIAFLDLFNQEDMIFGLRDQQRSNPDASPGAYIFAAGPCLTATNGHCSEYGVPTRLVNSPADAEREIDALAPRKPDVVKIVYDNRTYGTRRMPTVDRATLEAVIANARRHGIKTVVHVGSWNDVRDAVKAGAAAVTHTPGPEPPPDDIPRLMVERGAAHIPTLAVQTDFARILTDRSMIQDPMLATLTTEPLRAAYLAASDTAAALRGWIAYQRSNMVSNPTAVRRLHQAGVTMLTGTDGGNLGVFQGWSVHREMELLVAAGLSAWDALRAATTSAATFLGQPWGVSAGNEATFVVLDASPVENITNTRRIHSVVLRGKLIDRASLLPRRPAGLD